MAPPKGPRKPLPDLSSATDEHERAQIELVGLLRELAAGLTYQQISARTVEVDPKAEGVVESVISVLLTNWQRRWKKGKTNHLELVVRALDPTSDQRDRFHELLGRAIHGAAAAEQAAEELRAWRAAARHVRCDAWTMDEFTPQDAEVHTAAGRRVATAPGGGDPADTVPPVYIHRIHDVRLHALVDQAAAGDLSGVILLEGTSSTGKTRSLYEAVQRLGTHWRVLVPRDAAGLVGIVDRRSELLDSPTVLWLNEIQRFFAAPGEGLSTRLLGDLLDAGQPLLVVGTIWPDKYPKLGDDQSREALAVLDQHRGWTHTVEVSSFTREEIAAVAAFARRDPRIERALDDPDHVGFTQTLAGAGELLELYRSTKGSFTRDLLDAAGDARRVGHDQVLTGDVLYEMALALWRHRNHLRVPTPGRQDSFTAASTAIRSMGGVQALIPIEDLNGSRGFDLADYLEEHISHVRRYDPVLDGEWRALIEDCDHLPYATLEVMRASASLRARFNIAETILNVATTTGDPWALVVRAEWLSERAGRSKDGETAWEAATATGEPEALISRAIWLKYNGRDDEAESVWEAAATTGDVDGLYGWASWLGRRPDRGAEAEAAWQAAAATGDLSSLVRFAQWLAEQDGRQEDTEAAWAAAIATGGTDALLPWARWLAGQPGRHDDAEAGYAEVFASNGEPMALVEWAEHLAGHHFRHRDVEAAWTAAIATGEPNVLIARAAWLSQQPGRQEDAEAGWAAAAATCNPHALLHRAEWLVEQSGLREDVEAAWTAAIATGEINALVGWARWLQGESGREDDSDAAWVAVFTATSDPGALEVRADWMAHQPDRQTDAEATWLAAEQAWRRSVVAGEGGGFEGLLRCIRRQTGRELEAAWTERVGLDAFGAAPPIPPDWTPT